MARSPVVVSMQRPVFLLIYSAAMAVAAPLMRRQSIGGSNSSNNNNEDNAANISPSVWVPAVVVVLALLGIFCFVWTRASVRERLRGMTSSVRSRQQNATREVTAAQLTNSNNSSTGGNGGTTAAATTRRPRRTRRTPSQMSTASLPAYMKEPGAQELVIFRGPDEGEMDASAAIAEAREAEEAEDEADDQADGLGRDDSLGMQEAETFAPRPMASVADVAASRTTLPMSDGARNAEDSTAELLPRTESQQSQTTDDAHTGADPAERRSLLGRPASDVPSEAPPGYDDEVTGSRGPPGLVESPEPPRTPPPVALPQPSSPPATPESARTDRRRSRLMSRVSNIMHFRGSSSTSTAVSVSTPLLEMNSRSPPGLPPTTSTITLNDTPPSSPPRARGTPTAQAHAHSRHRSSQSGGSGSTLGIVGTSPFRTVSRQRSTTTLNSHAGSRTHLPLTSPSTLSLTQSLAAGASPIGAPLPHTLVRTEFRYPRGGPTPDQMRLIASRESLASRRFGVPFGEDAVAAAAAASRVTVHEGGEDEEDDDPPPQVDFEDEPGEDAEHVDGPAQGEDPDVLPMSENVQSSHSRSRSGSAERMEESTYDTARILVPLFM